MESQSEGEFSENADLGAVGVRSVLGRCGFGVGDCFIQCTISGGRLSISIGSTECE